MGTALAVPFCLRVRQGDLQDEVAGRQQAAKFIGKRKEQHERKVYRPQRGGGFPWARRN